MCCCNCRLWTSSMCETLKFPATHCRTLSSSYTHICGAAPLSTGSFMHHQWSHTHTHTHTHIHAHLWSCAVVPQLPRDIVLCHTGCVSARPLYLDYRALVTVETFSVLSNVVIDSPVSLLRFVSCIIHYELSPQPTNHKPF